MNNSPINIICPNCSHQIEIGDAIKQQLENENTRKKDDEIFNLKNKAIQLEQAQKILENQNKREIEDLLSRKNLQFERDKIELAEVIKNKIQNENKELETLRLKQKDDEIHKLKQEKNDSEKLKIEIEKLKIENQNKERDLKQKLEIEAQQKFDFEIKSVKNTLEGKFRIEIEEKTKELERQKSKIEELSKSQNRTTVELKGEAFEDLIKRDLVELFADDTISDVKKGETGADFIVNVQHKNDFIGKLIIECKNAANFQKTYIDKLSKDKSVKGAEIAIIISVNLPKDKENTHLYNVDGVWVCRYGYHKEALNMFRDQMLKINQVTKVNNDIENKSIKLYNYLTSQNFNDRFSKIFDSYQVMKSAIDSEKKAMNTNWKLREKQLETIFNNFLEVKGNIEIIAMDNQLMPGLDFNNNNLYLDVDNDI